MGEGVKRKFTSSMDSSAQAETPPSPFLPMFEQFRAELDTHHDRRERITKASRDITAASKKIIFALQRIKTLNSPPPPHITKATAPHQAAITANLAAIAPDLQSVNAHRYNRQISPGLQEYLEARLFAHYLETQTILPYDAAAAELNALVAPALSAGEPEADKATRSSSNGIPLTPEDYLLALFDTTGEMMRFAITTMALSDVSSEDEDKDMSGPPRRTVVADLQQLRVLLSDVDARSDFPFPMSKSWAGKMGVMLASVDKVERALYGLRIRGSERPKGWMPDLSEGREVEAEG